MKRAIIKDREELLYFLQDFNTDRFALDTETTDLAFNKQELLVISICDGNKTGVLIASHEVLDIFKYIQPTVLVGHNIIFDLKVLSKYGLHYPETTLFDTMVAWHLCDEESERGLKFLSGHLLGYEMAEYDERYLKLTVKELLEEKNSLIDRFLMYAALDAEATWNLAMILKEKIQEEGVANLFHKIEMPFLKALLQMELNGVLVDEKNLKETTKRVKEEILNLEIKLHELIKEPYQLQMNLADGSMTVISKLNLNSGNQLAEVLFGKLGLEEVGKTKTGKLKTGKDAIQKLKGQSEFVATLEQYKIATKIYKAFLLPLPQFISKEGRVHPNFNDVGTVTGRLSSRDPNLQQLPKSRKEFPVDVRGFFIASPGKKMVSVDYSQQEIRVMTHLCRDPTLIKIINDDGDLHLVNANNVFNLGIPEEKLFTSHPDYNAVKKKYSKERDQGKVFSFGVAYGMGPHKLSRDFNVAMQEAEKLLENFFSGFPLLREAIVKTHIQAEEELSVSTMFNRRRHFKKNAWGKLDDKSLRQSFNFLIQSTGADLIRLAAIKLDQYAKEHPEMGVKLLMTVHDEICYEVNERYAEDSAKAATKIFESCANLIVPLKADYAIADNYGGCK